MLGMFVTACGIGICWYISEKLINIRKERIILIQQLAYLNEVLEYTDNLEASHLDKKFSYTKDLEKKFLKSTPEIVDKFLDNEDYSRIVRSYEKGNKAFKFYIVTLGVFIFALILYSELYE